MIVVYIRFDTQPEFIKLEPAEKEGVEYYLYVLNSRKDLFEKIYDDGSAAVYRFLPNTR